LKKKLICSILAASALFADNSFDLNINNNTLEVNAQFNMNESYDLNPNSDYYFYAKYLKTKEDDSLSTSQTISTLGFKMLNPMSDQNGLSLGLGMKSVYSKQSASDKSFTATPISIFGKYEFSEILYFDAEIAYAPRILTFLDGKTYQEGRLNANFKILENGYIYTGIRNIKTKYTNDIEEKYDDNIFFGLKVVY